MDPAVYARAFGVQSEANKVTVTRVACNEISYRRVVNTFRKDMNSTVNNIRREQKKLRRCMRGYRKKLHGNDKKVKKPYKFGWIANTHPDDDVDLRTEYVSPSDKKSPGGTATDTENVSHQRDKEISIVKMYNNPQLESLQTQVQAFLKAPNIKLKSKVKEDENESNINKSKTRFGKERRRFVIGSGKIESPERAIKDVFYEDGGHDSYSLVSDSSDDEEFSKGRVDGGRGKYSTSSSRLRETHDGLIRSNSAYFKPVNLSQNEKNDQNAILTEIPDKDPGNEAKHIIVLGLDEAPNQEHGGQHEGEQSSEGMGKYQLISLPTVLPVIPGEVSAVPKATDATFPALNNENIRIPKRKKPVAGNGISFGDIAKLHHGLKTKTLFSLVDKLASRHGIVGDIKSDNFSEKPYPRSSNKKVFRDSFGDRNLSLATYSSVFYPMKYGYVSDGDDSSKHSDLSPNPSLKVKAERFATHLSVPDSGIYSEPTQVLSARLSQLDLQDENSDDRSVDRTNVSLQPLKPDATKSSMTTGPKVVGATPSFDGGEEVDRGAMELQALQRRRDSRFQRQRRRSSMLEASQFVKSLRNKGMNKKMSFSSEVDSLGDKRRDSNMSSDDNELSPDIHKVAWSSALSRMKLVHTLVDFTHII